MEYMQRVGVHELPLIGTGDWNDGMDRVGHLGRGESVWLAWFQLRVISLFSPIALSMDDKEKVRQWKAYADRLELAIATHAWDGEWYARAFDDEGEPWGSHENDECRIDLIAQAWSVLSGVGDSARAQQAMQSAAKHLVDKELNLAKLLTPPFFLTSRNPGYIKSYPPGIRENGGQYTHAACWYGLACAELGLGDDAKSAFDCINPVQRALCPADVERYQREPYVVCADIAGPCPATPPPADAPAASNIINLQGRGGWSWYTGAAAWAWQLGVQGILGLAFHPGAVSIEPCLPRDWDQVELKLKGNEGGRISLRLENPHGVCSGIAHINVDGKTTQSNLIAFPPAGCLTRVIFRLGQPEPTQ